MKKKFFAGLLISLTPFVFVGMAEATHIQFFDFADLDADGTSPSTISKDSLLQTPTIINTDFVTIGNNDTYSYTFDLLALGSLDLFDLDAPYAYLGTGAYDSDYALHYVTLRIDPKHYAARDLTSNYLKLEVNGLVVTGWENPIRIYDWGKTNPPGSDIYGIGTLDYQIEVKLTGLAELGDGTIDITNVNLEGCFDTAPIPEPATMLLFGTGLVGLVGSRLRKKKK